MKRLHDIVANKKRMITKNCFNLPKTDNVSKKEITYLIFEGLLRVIMTTKNKLIQYYIKWAK